MLIRAGTLVLTVALSSALPAAAQVQAPLDEAARACPARLDGAPAYGRWWCGFDPADVVANVDGEQRLTAFETHPYPSISTMPSEAGVDLDWVCIEGECGGLLDPSFIIARELSHVWTPEAGGPRLVMTEDRWRRAVEGRNSWLLWAGGNHAFWDHLARHAMVSRTS